MKNKYFLLALTCLTATWSSCSDDKVFVPEYTVSLQADVNMTSTVSTNTTYQVIDGFSGSGAWTLDYVGKYWENSAKEGMAKLLFSQNVKSGSPEGIGLSMWRFCLGGGTAEQGAESGIEDKVRRGECFRNEDGTYNWTKSIGQQYFMEKAKEYGCGQFVLFGGTAPVYWTKNGKGFSASGAHANLKDDCYDDFADFLATVAGHFQGKGYNISYVSPVNEPQYNWTSGQEGSGWQHSEIKKLAIELDKSLTAKGLDQTQMLLAEAAAWNYLYEDGNSGGRGNVIDNFFNPSSANYIGDLKHMPKLICGHSYWTDLTWNTLQDVRSRVYNTAKPYDLKIYQTEWSMMEEGYEDCPIYDNASYMDIALAMGKVIHHDLVTANVSSWSYWTAASQEQYSQKSRFYLIRLIPEGGDYGDIEKSGTYAASKNLWVLGNYSLFIRPGYRRVELNIPEQSNQFYGSAYLSPDKDKLVVVYTNASSQSVQIENTIQDLEKQVVSVQQYTTSNAKDLRLESESQRGYIPAKSVVTLVYDLK